MIFILFVHEDCLALVRFETTRLVIHCSLSLSFPLCFSFVLVVFLK